MFVLLISLLLMATILAIGLSLNSLSRQSLDNIAQRIQGEIAARIVENLNNFLNSAYTLVELNSSQKWDLSDLDTLRQRSWNQLNSFKSISAIFAANAKKEFVGVERGPDGQKFVGVQELLKKHPDYDPTLTPWYKKAFEQGNAVWAGVYPLVSHDSLYLTMVKQEQGATNKSGIDGVFAAAINLQEISKFLKTLKVGVNGRTFVIEQNGYLVGSSADELLCKENNGILTRIKGRDSEDIIITAAVMAIEDKLNLSGVDKPVNIKYNLSSKAYSLSLVPFRDGRGISWLVGIIIAEDELNQDFDDLGHRILLVSVAALLLAILCGLIVSRYVSKPVERLTKAAEIIADGDFDHEVRVEGTYEIKALANSFNVMLLRLRLAFMELKDANQDLEERVAFRTRELTRLAVTDALTGLSNRRHADEVLEAEIKRAERYGHNLAIALIDLDNFKQVNDLFGHSCGDKVLQIVAAIMAAELREVDLAARFGGEEFLIIMPETALDDAFAAIDRLREEIAKHTIPCMDRNVTLSAGITLWQKGEQPSRFVARADELLYKAKHDGRNRVMIG